MNHSSTGSIVVSGQNAGKSSNLVALACLSVLYFMLGFITCLNDTLVPFFKLGFTLSYAASSLVQFYFFLVYGLFSIPAGRIIERVGYKKGMIFGFLFSAAGALLFYPAAEFHVYYLFLAALFVVAIGIVFMQVAANPYIIVLGPSHSASARLNLIQSVGSVGTIVAPLFGAAVILPGISTAGSSEAVKYPYLGIAAVLVLISIVVGYLKLPVISQVSPTGRSPQTNQSSQTDQLFRTDQPPQTNQSSQTDQLFRTDQPPQMNQSLQTEKLFQTDQPPQVNQSPQTGQLRRTDQPSQMNQLSRPDQLPRTDQSLQSDQSPQTVETGKPVKKTTVFSFRNLNLGALGIFFFVGIEIAIASFLTNYIADVLQIREDEANRYVAVYWTGMLVGRLIGVLLLRTIKPRVMLVVNAVIAIGLIIVSVSTSGYLAVWSLLCVGLFNSVLFAIIFSLSINGLGEHITRASGVLSAAISGGAVIVVIQGWLIDSVSWATAFMIPVLCYLYIIFYGINGYKSRYNEQ